jgi:hypothetical protein
MPIRAHVIEGDTRFLIPGQHCALNGDVFARVCFNVPYKWGLIKTKPNVERLAKLPGLTRRRVSASVAKRWRHNRVLW